ncbi:MAG: sensor histidine kinase [Ferruginibacter sp.]
MKAILNNRILQHIAFWCFYIVLYTGNYATNGMYVEQLSKTLIYLPTTLLFTYLQLYYLIPVFLLKKKVAAYIIFTAILTKIIFGLIFILEVKILYRSKFTLPGHDIPWDVLWKFEPEELKTVFALFLICGIAVAIKLLKKLYYESDRSQKIEKEKLSMELEMLKAQVHPHFLFNTLNNLYSLTLTHSDKAPIVVTHLSELLRYMLYECDEKEVPLEKEIETLKKYVELEKLRYGSRIDVSFVSSGNIKDNMIAPLLLIPFVENSFKYGTSEQLGQCWVNLNFYADGNDFTFNLTNSISNEKTRSLSGGIGLQNIKKRLELIYPGKYTLTANEDAGMFIVKLQIQLNPAKETKIATVNNDSFVKQIPAAV